MSNFTIQSGSVSNFTTAISDGWYTVNFETPFPEGVVPQVSAQIQTYAGKDTPGLRLKNVSNTGFKVTMAEVYQSKANSTEKGDLGVLSGSGTHSNAERLGWIAVAIG